MSNLSNTAKVTIVTRKSKDGKDLKFIQVPSINNKVTEIRYSLTNLILAQKSYRYDVERDQLEFEINGYTGSIGAEGVFIKRPNSSKTGSNAKQETRCRCLHIAELNNKVNLTRLYCLGKEIALGTLTLKEIDKLVINHKDNQGLLEGTIDDNRPLDIQNYEVVSYGKNTKHGEVWYKLYDFGIYTKFSALDTTFINLADMSETLEQFVEHLKVQGLKLEDYIWGLAKEVA